MAEDYYKTLKVRRDAPQAEIQKAYRDLARKYHPDLNPNDKSAKEKFQKVQAAFDVLNDPAKRELYDRYGSSFESFAQGGPRPQPRGGGPGSAGAEDVDFSQFFGERYGSDPSSLFGDIFGQFRRAEGKTRGRRGRAAPAAGGDAHHEVQVSFQTAVSGGEVELSVVPADGKPHTLKVKIPPGIAEGAKIRLRGQGEPAADGGQSGDLLLTIHIAPHPFFTRRGNDLEVKLPVTLAEAVLGAKVDVPTPRGTISLSVPPRTSSGTKLRVKGFGIQPKSGAGGDLYADIQIMLPDELDESVADAIRKADAKSPKNPRSDLKW